MSRAQMRAVAFFDVLGFKAMLDREPLTSIVASFSHLLHLAEHDNLAPASELDEARGPTLPPVPSLFADRDRDLCIRSVFSDSLIAVSKDESEDSVLKFLVHVWRIARSFISHKRPIRGGIAFGEMHADTKRNLFVGKALTTAYLLEASQEWIGAAIDASLVERYPRLFDGRRIAALSRLFVDYDVPLKGGVSRRLFTLNWRHSLVVVDGTRSLLPVSSSDDVKLKVDNTIAYLQHVVRNGLHRPVAPGQVPVELATAYVSERPPTSKPPKHGDDL